MIFSYVPLGNSQYWPFLRPPMGMLRLMQSPEVSRMESRSPHTVPSHGDTPNVDPDTSPASKTQIQSLQTSAWPWQCLVRDEMKGDGQKNAGLETMS